MTLYSAPFAAAEPVRAVLSTTLVDIVAAAGGKQPIAKIHVCNTSASPVAVDIAVFDGTTAFYIEKGRVIAANTSLELRDEVLQVNHSLQMKAAAAAVLHAHVTFSLSPQLV